MWFWVLFLTLIIVISCFYTVFFYSGFQVQNIIISGNQKVNTEDLRNIIIESTNREIFRLGDFKISSRSIFLVDEGKINEEALNVFHTIEKLAVRRTFPQTLNIVVYERDAAGVFCGDNLQCFMIDRSGIVYQKVAIDQLDSSWVIIRQTMAGRNIFTGEGVVAQNIVDAISKIQKDLKDNYQIGLKEALISSPIRLNLTTDKNWQIYFDLGQGSNISLQIKKLDLLLSGGISESEMKNLRYIDLRPTDRAIICDNATCGG
jgi:cell division septal protein FtsQ